MKNKVLNTLILVNLVSVLLFAGTLNYTHKLYIKNKLLKAQLETIEPELPTGYMKALDDRTVSRLDIFCADWDELRKGEQK